MTLEIQHGQSLRPHNSLGLDVEAEHLAVAKSEGEVREALAVASKEGWPLTILGGGSNVVLTGTVPGLTLLVTIPGVSIDGEYVTAGAGENWHQLVLTTIEAGLSGLENLALIPGSVGAAPIQNIGAYGVELDRVFESLSAIDRQSGETVELSKQDCEFGYRDSIFKRSAKDRYIITAVTLKLSKSFIPNFDYADLQAAFGESSNVTPQQLAEKVCEIRRSKLPDPAVTGNAGSFFKNPVVSEAELQRLLSECPGIAHWRQADSSIKVSAAWLIDQCDFRGVSVGGATVSEQHALVIINSGDATPVDVLALAKEIEEKVKARFDIQLEIEPRLI